MCVCGWVLAGYCSSLVDCGHGELLFSHNFEKIECSTVDLVVGLETTTARYKAEGKDSASRLLVNAKSTIVGSVTAAAFTHKIIYIRLL